MISGISHAYRMCGVAEYNLTLSIYFCSCATYDNSNRCVETICSHIGIKKSLFVFWVDLKKFARLMFLTTLGANLKIDTAKYFNHSLNLFQTKTARGRGLSFATIFLPERTHRLTNIHARITIDTTHELKCFQKRCQT